MEPQEIKKNENQPNDMPILHNGSTKRVVNDQNVAKSKEAAAELIRHQIDQILDHNDKQYHEQTVDKHPYDKTHTPHVEPQADQWKKYHTAWQNYYQKYYEGYYSHQYKQAIDNTTQNPDQAKKNAEKKRINELKQNLLDKVQTSAKKVRKSRHFIPIIASLLVVIIFLALQYNQLIIANIVAYVSPGKIDPQNIIIDPNSNFTVSADPKLIIPKINVDVPVIYDIGSDYDSQMSAMTKGVAQFAIPGANSHPGEAGNTVIAGHSSNDLFDSGDYKFIFAQLEKLNTGDMIYANYKSKRYSYSVTKKEVVSPNEVSKLTTPTTKPILTLITCTPLGTSKYRLLVTAEQVSPDPATASAANTASTDSNSSIPGSTPSFIEKIFGAK